MENDRAAALLEFARAATWAMAFLAPVTLVLTIRPDLVVQQGLFATALGALIAAVEGFVVAPVETLRMFGPGPDMPFRGARVLGFVPLTVGLLAIVAARRLTRGEASGVGLAVAVHATVLVLGPPAAAAGTGAAAVLALAAVALYALTRPAVRARLAP